MSRHLVDVYIRRTRGDYQRGEDAVQLVRSHDARRRKVLRSLLAAGKRGGRPPGPTDAVACARVAGRPLSVATLSAADRVWAIRVTLGLRGLLSCQHLSAAVLGVGLGAGYKVKVSVVGPDGHDEVVEKALKPG